MPGVSFAGDGSKDCNIDRSSTNAPNVGAGGGNHVEFAGDGDKDVSHAFGTKVEKGGPSGSGVKFAGDGMKDTK